MSHRAIVTGGSRGIGFAIARAILRGGGRVMITGRDDRRLQEAVHSLGKLVRDSSRAAGTVVDVRDRAGIERLIDDTARRFGGIDTLVNNAGVGVFTEVSAMTDDEWADVIETNLTGVFYCSRAAIPELRKAGGAWIINIASLAGRNYFPGGAAYCASKAGLIAFSEALMQEVRYDDIRVTVIMPGSVSTEFSGPADPDGIDSWKLSTEDVAECVMDLLRHPPRSLPSRVEIRPSKPAKKS
jgi:NAD(P)-dependent dehydrogenase (short-subunit alcohol dehydrogenase family)